MTRVYMVFSILVRKSVLDLGIHLDKHLLQVRVVFQPWLQDLRQNLSFALHAIFWTWEGKLWIKGLDTNFSFQVLSLRRIFSYAVVIWSTFVVMEIIRKVPLGNIVLYYLVAIYEFVEANTIWQLTSVGLNFKFPHFSL